MTLPAVLFSGRRWACLLALIGGGCGEAGIPNRADSSTIAAGAQPEMPLPMDGVQVRLVVPEMIASGDTVPIAIRLTNTTASTVELYLRGREIAFDIIIADGAGNEVWRLLHGDPILAVLQLRTLTPGETLELRHAWDQQTPRGGPVPAGAYTVRGEVLTDGSSSLVSNEVGLVITRRRP